MSSFKIYPQLRPLAMLYKAGVTLRNALFDRGILPSRRFPLPVICVGNLTVGGTGKTPHTEYLIRLLQDEYQVAVLSRGYRRKSKGFVLATPETPLREIGDEPFQMAHKFPGIYMAVDRDRRHGIERLTDGVTAPGTQVIILDDAFQHRYVKAGLNILLTDYNRLVYLDRMLPEGRLREPLTGLSRADIVVVTKCPPGLSSTHRQHIRAELKQRCCHLSLTVYFSSLTYGNLQPLFAERPGRKLDSLTDNDHLLLVTGIASPQPLLDKMREYTSSVTLLAFADHHDFSAADLRRIKEAYCKLPPGKSMIVTTEKDASRLLSHPALDEELKAALYVLPVTVAFIDEEEEDREKISFNQKITEYVREDSRNSSLSEG